MKVVQWAAKHDPGWRRTLGIRTKERERAVLSSPTTLSFQAPSCLQDIKHMHMDILGSCPHARATVVAHLHVSADGAKQFSCIEFLQYTHFQNPGKLQRGECKSTVCKSDISALQLPYNFPDTWGSFQDKQPLIHQLVLGFINLAPSGIVPKHPPGSIQVLGAPDIATLR